MGVINIFSNDKVVINAFIITTIKSSYSYIYPLYQLDQLGYFAKVFLRKTPFSKVIYWR